METPDGRSAHCVFELPAIGDRDSPPVRVRRLSRESLTSSSRPSASPPPSRPLPARCDTGSAFAFAHAIGAEDIAGLPHGTEVRYITSCIVAEGIISPRHPGKVVMLRYFDESTGTWKPMNHEPWPIQEGASVSAQIAPRRSWTRAVASLVSRPFQRSVEAAPRAASFTVVEVADVAEAPKADVPLPAPAEAKGTVMWKVDPDQDRVRSRDKEHITTHATVPKEFRKMFAQRLSLILCGYSKATVEKKREIWHEFLSFPKALFRALKGKAGKSHVKAHLGQQLAGTIVAQTGMKDGKKQLEDASGDVEASVIRRACAKARDGFLGKSARLLDSAGVAFMGTPAQKQAELQKLHPREEALRIAVTRKSATTIDIDAMVKAAIHSCKGAAVGPSGWSDEMLATMLENETCRAEFAVMISDVVNDTGITACVRDRLTTCRLFALPKTEWTLRPIAIGESVLKLAESMALEAVKPSVAKLFANVQFGVGAKGGGETIVHRTRQLLAEDPSRVVCTIDCVNAFNAVKRSAIHDALRAMPALRPLLPIFRLCYSEHSDLVGDDVAIKSQSGVRQGSVLGPLFFSLATHAAMQKIVAKYPTVAVFLYIDDTTLVGPPEDVARAALDIEDLLLPLGLAVNRKKSEWLGGPINSAPPGYAVVTAIKVLGAYVGNQSAVREKLSAMGKKQVDFFRRFAKLPPDVASALLTVCGVPKTNYVVRTHDPRVAHEYTVAFDSKVETIWSDIFEVDPDEQTRLVAHLPTSLGGMGFTRMEFIADEVFKASWEAAVEGSKTKAAVLVEKKNKAMIAGVCASKPELLRHLEETSKEGTSAYLRDPRLSVGAKPSEFAAAGRFRLAEPHRGLKNQTLISCTGCATTLRPHEFNAHVAGCALLHGFNCSSRHAGVKDVLNSVAQDAGVPFDRHEPRYKAFVCPGCRTQLPVTDKAAAEKHYVECTRLTAKQRAEGVGKAHKTGPDGRFTMQRKGVVFDVTVLSTTARSAGKDGEAAAKKANQKNRLYASMVEADGDEFVVFGASAFGHLEEEASKLVKRLCHTFDSIERSEAFGRITAAIALSTGRVIREAERAQGVKHRQQDPANAPSSTEEIVSTLTGHSAAASASRTTAIPEEIISKPTGHSADRVGSPKEKKKGE
jgi:hypothetical protein